MCEHGTQVVLPLPDWMLSWQERRTACVDNCIVETIKALWSAGYETLGCCCGHGKDRPNVVVADGYDDNEVAKIAEVIRRCDERDWDVFQWRIQIVARTSAGTIGQALEESLS